MLLMARRGELVVVERGAVTWPRSVVDARHTGVIYTPSSVEEEHVAVCVLHKTVCGEVWSAGTRGAGRGGTA